MNRFESGCCPLPRLRIPLTINFISMLQPRLILAILASLMMGSATGAPPESVAPKVVVHIGKTRGLVYSPTPGYPKEAIKRHWGGLGLYEIHFRGDGLVSAVFVTLSAGHKVLDDAVVSTLHQWRYWKGYRGVVLAVPVTFVSGDNKTPGTGKQNRR